MWLELFLMIYMGIGRSTSVTWSWVNFTNILRAHFSYESSFKAEKSCSKDVRTKNSHVKRWWNWLLVKILLTILLTNWQEKRDWNLANIHFFKVTLTTSWVGDNLIFVRGYTIFGVIQIHVTFCFVFKTAGPIWPIFNL